MSETGVTETTASDPVETSEGTSDEEKEAALVEAFEMGLLNTMLGNSQVDRAIQSEARSQYQQLQSGN